MRYCKKFKAPPVLVEAHHRRPGGDCRSCVYFSQMNCGRHQEAVQENGVNLFAFDA